MCFFFISARRARVFYRGTTTHLCDLCEDTDCESICKAEAKAREGRERHIGDESGKGDGGAAVVQIYFIPYIIVVAIFVNNW